MAEKIGLEAVMDMAGFTQGMKQYTGGIDQMVDKTEKGSSIFGKIGGVLEGVAKVGIGAAVAGFGALTAIIADSVDEAAKAQEVDAQLDAVLKATGGTAGVTKDEILKLADSLSKVTPYEDDIIAATETVLLQFRNIGEDVFPQATEMALDLATRLGIDTTSAAKLLGKALEEPGEGLARLKQAGVNFTDEQEKMIKKMVAAGDTAGAQKYIMDELEKSIGGAARAAGETFSGKLDILKNSIGNVKESIGAAFLPVLTELVDKFSAFVQDNAPAIEAFFRNLADWIMNKAIPALLDIYNWLAVNLPPVIQAFSDYWSNVIAPAIQIVWAFIEQKLIPAITNMYLWLAENLPIAIQTLSDFWTNTLQPALAAIWDFIVVNVIPVLTEVYNWLATNLPIAIQTVTDFWTNILQPALLAIWTFITTYIVPIFQQVASWFTGEGTTSVTGWVTTIQTFLAPIIAFMAEQFSFIVNWVKDNWPLIQQTIETVMTKIKEVVDTVLNTIRDFWQKHGDAIMGIAKKAWDIIKTAIDTAIKVVAGIIKTIMQIINGDWQGAWDTIKATLNTAWEGIKKIVGDALDIIKIVWEEAKKIIEESIQKFADKLAEIWTNVKNKATELWQSMIDSIQQKIIDLGGWLYEAGKNIVNGLYQGMREVFREIIEWIRDQIERIKDMFAELFAIGSPSKWAIRIGKQITIGLGKGLEEGFKVPVTAVLGGVRDVKNAMSRELGGGLMTGYSSQALTPAYATSQNVNVSFGDTTINSGLDAELFQAQVLQTVTRAVRGY